MADPAKVVVVGAGFAGIGCARELAKHPHHAEVTVVDAHDYHQFLPLLYQVATFQLAGTDVSMDLDDLFKRHDNVSFRQATATSVDPAAKTVTLDDGTTLEGDYLVLAAGSQANFFGTPGAEHTFPLYSLDDARRLRARVLEAFEEAEKDPSTIETGGLNFVIVGAGATGTEIAGALADLIRDVMPSRFHDEQLSKARVVIVDAGETVLGPFSPKAHEYASKVLTERGVELKLGTKVNEITADRVVLSDGDTIDTRCVIWGGGLQAAPLAASAGLAQGRGGRIDVHEDLTAEGFPGVFVVGDIANIPSDDGRAFPQLGSVALQAGQWAAKNIVADVDGTAIEPFDYHDKGIMAMIGHNAAIAEMGEHRHELHGAVGYAAWIGVHAYLMGVSSQRRDAFISWAWDEFGKSRVLDTSDEARLHGEGETDG
ncbi:MAG TPA: NAD(P)/FAD-dependent oxidoreductase [Actinomycetota bacterium]|jgi:NADH dehydrogenase|nr:NAD(P)/FAD-dependent oxidoreductase [Actinomycetota bacterium]